MKRIFKYPIIFAVVFSLVSCERDEPANGEGVSMSDLYEDFSFTENLAFSSKSADFSLEETISVSAKFSKPVDWKITIQGVESGAQKEITGFSNELNAENTTWNGSTTKFPIFRAEKCIYRLDIVDEILQTDTFLVDTVEATGTKTNEGVLIEDFEDEIKVAKWPGFVQSGADMTFVRSNAQTAAQGEYYYDMGGAVDFDFLIGQINFPSSVLGTPTFGLSENAEEVYLNMMVYNPPGVINGFYVIQFQENEDGKTAFDKFAEDGYQYEIDETDLTSGWQLISIRMSDIVMGETFGNAKVEPNKINFFTILFLADPASGYSQGFIDYIIFTEGGPLEP